MKDQTRHHKSEWKWSNVPIPAQHILGLLLGIVLQFVKGYGVFSEAIVGTICGLPLVLLGVYLAGWSVLQVGEASIEQPRKLITGGPYALSRNPMYVAWGFIFLGVGLILNSVWVMALLPVVVLYTHFVDILREEKFLEGQFGEEYLRYRRRVGRYL